MITTSVSLHVNDVEPDVKVREDYVAVALGIHVDFFFRNREQLRDFAESILQQLEQKEEVSA